MSSDQVATVKARRSCRSSLRQIGEKVLEKGKEKDKRLRPETELQSEEEGAAVIPLVDIVRLDPWIPVQSCRSCSSPSRFGIRKGEESQELGNSLEGWLADLHLSSTVGKEFRELGNTLERWLEELGLF